MSLAPLILTLGLDDEATARFDALRTAHFPPGRLVVGAHLTLFNALPGDQESLIRVQVRETAAATPPLRLQVARVLLLGRGVAFALKDRRLTALRGRLAALWSPWLTPQDVQPHRPHVTIQNKVDPAVARALHEQLSAGFVPFEVRGEALRLWRYVGGPWEHVLSHPLSG